MFRVFDYVIYFEIKFCAKTNYISGFSTGLVNSCGMILGIFFSIGS